MIRVGNEQARLLRKRRNVTLGVHASEREIIYHLGIGTVYFCPVRETMYFYDSVDVSISSLINRVLKNVTTISCVEDVYLDDLHYFSNAKKIKLQQSEVKPILVALRLAGIQINLGKES